jgi:hypothetical protein
VQTCLLSRLSRHPASGVVPTIILPPSHLFTSSTEDAHQKDCKQRNSDSAAGNAHLDVAAPRQTGKIGTELCSSAIVWWGFLGLIRFSRLMEYGDGVSRRMVN